jgi:branched-chain amino acid transport system ATP-binding protein
VLEVKNLTVKYETATLLNNISLEVKKDECVGIIGPNGAGKTTTLRAICGSVVWDRKFSLRGTRYGNIALEGSIIFEGERIDGLLPHEIVRKGIALCPQGYRLFSELTVLENLKAGAFMYDKKEADRRLKDVFELFPKLEERKDQISGTLSGGERQMLAIGRALMSKPKLLCIDEPSGGLAPILKEKLYEKLKEIRSLGISLLIVEEDASLLLDFADRIYVFSRGHVVAEGSRDFILQSEQIREAYIGI